MTDIEKMLTEVRGVMEYIRDGRHEPSCPIGQHDVAPGGHECNCPQLWATAALATLTAEMPGAIGRVMRHPDHEAICRVGPGRPCDCGLDAALATLEVK